MITPGPGRHHGRLHRLPRRRAARRDGRRASACSCPATCFVVIPARYFRRSVARPAREGVRRRRDRRGHRRHRRRGVRARAARHLRRADGAHLGDRPPRAVADSREHRAARHRCAGAVGIALTAYGQCRRGVIAARAVAMASRDGPRIPAFGSTDAAVAHAGEVEVEFGYAGFRKNDEGVTIVAPTRRRKSRRRPGRRSGGRVRAGERPQAAERGEPADRRHARCRPSGSCARGSCRSGGRALARRGAAVCPAHAAPRAPAWRGARRHLLSRVDGAWSPPSGRGWIRRESRDPGAWPRSNGANVDAADAGPRLPAVVEHPGAGGRFPSCRSTSGAGRSRADDWAGTAGVTLPSPSEEQNEET